MLIFALFSRESRLLLTRNMFLILGFFILVILSFTLSATENLAPFAHSLIWASLLLAHLLLMPHFFEDDIEQGVMELMVIESELPVMIILAKVFAAWVILIWPVIILIPFTAMMFHLEPLTFLPLMISALIGSLGLIFIAIFIAALTRGLSQQIGLAPLLLIPLELPFLIFGALSARQDWALFWVAPSNWLLMGLVLCAMVSTPVLTLAALKE